MYILLIARAPFESEHTFPWKVHGFFIDSDCAHFLFRFVTIVDVLWGSEHIRAKCRAGFFAWVCGLARVLSFRWQPSHFLQVYVVFSSFGAFGWTSFREEVQQRVLCPCFKRLFLAQRAYNRWREQLPTFFFFRNFVSLQDALFSLS